MQLKISASKYGDNGIRALGGHIWNSLPQKAKFNNLIGNLGKFHKKLVSI